MLFNFFLLQTPAASNPILGFLPVLLIFGIFYFLLFMPMQRQKKKLQTMLSELKNGDVVTTSGGIVGSIVSMEGDNLVLRIKPDNIKIQFLRSAVSGRLSDDIK